MKKKGKKIFALLMSCSLVFSFIGPRHSLLFVNTVYGAEKPATVHATSLNVRSGPGTDSSVISKLSFGTRVTVVSENTGVSGWYQIRMSSGTTGYVMGSYLKFTDNASPAATDANFETYMMQQGFPESYKPYLRSLHDQYPNWVFKAFNTGLDWNEVISSQSLVGRNLVHRDSISSWKSTADGAYNWDTSSWPGFDGSAWVAASSDIIGHYMDPRNFLNDIYVFQFLSHEYDPSLQTREGLTALVKDTFLAGNAPVSSAYLAEYGGPANADSPSAQTPADELPETQPSADQQADSPPADNQPEGNQSSQEEQPSVSLEAPGASKSSHSPGMVQAVIIRTGPGEDSGNSSSNSNSSGGSSAGGGTSYGPGVAPGAENNASAGGNASSPGTSSSGEVSYVDVLMKAGELSGVSPYVLASMIIQEQGTQGKSDSISGKSGYYNFYNFQAYAANGMSAVQRGIWYASQSGDYMRPWNTAERAIIGGAMQYGQTYVKAGQDTFYLKKFNVQGSNLYKHQYMTNVEGAASEGAKISNAYSAQMKQAAMEFSIPVYRNMPEAAVQKPTGDGSPNNKLKQLSAEGYTLTPGFDKDRMIYDLIIDANAAEINLSAAAIDANAQISGIGRINLSNTTTEVKISVTAQNGTVREYVVKIARKGQGNVSQPSQNQPSQNQPSSPAPSSTGGPGGSNVTIVN